MIKSMLYFKLVGALFMIMTVSCSPDEGSSDGPTSKSDTLTLNSDVSSSEIFIPPQALDEDGGKEGLYFMIRPNQEVTAGLYAVGGMFTAVIFSAEWCIPCATLRDELRVTASGDQRLAVVDLDVGDVSGIGVVHSSILSVYGSDAAIPAGLLLDRYGVPHEAGGGIMFVSSTEILEGVRQLLGATESYSALPIRPDSSKIDLAQADGR